MDNASIGGDRPLDDSRNDKLGFSEVAKRIAASLVDSASDNGLVVGLEGKWGSGKSSLLHLIESELQRLPEPERPSVINFRPWIVGNRDALLRDLFASLLGEINEVEHKAGDATGVTLERAKAARDALQGFVGGLAQAGAAVEWVGDAIAFAPLKWVGKGLTVAGEAVDGEPSETPLSELKERLVKALRDLGHRFVVTIDDVDRLEPSEALEVLRLTRSVADFPNVTYLLCYDEEVLAEGIQHASGVGDGRAFLEKMIQLQVMVPLPEAFMLRQWFGNELCTFTSVKNDHELSRLKSVIDYEGGRQLTTPRAVVRVLDAVRFLWKPIHDAGADLADLVWLQLIKVGDPALYRWIEEYCSTSASLLIGTARVETAERDAETDRLLSLVEPSRFVDPVYRHYFADNLPGVEIDYASDGKTFKLFQRVTPNESDRAIRGRRLASADHYRLYFALSVPEHALTQGDWDQFWEATDTGESAAANVMLDLHQVEVQGGIGKADLLLERLRSVEPDALTEERSHRILLAFANVLDLAFETRSFEVHWAISLWDRAERLIPFLLANLPPEKRRQCVEAMFADGSAIGWLTSVMRRETFAHGRFGDNEKPKSDWFLTDEELDVVFDRMVARFRSLEAPQILATVRPIDLLYAWRQAGDEEGPIALVSKHVETDAGLIEALEKVTSLVNSSDRGTYSVLSRQNIEAFFDFDAARSRIDELATTDTPLAERASELAKAFANNDDR